MIVPRKVLYVLLVTLIAGCASTSSYNVPLRSRSRYFPYSVPATIDAAKFVLQENGFAVAYVDTSTGTIYTEPKNDLVEPNETGGVSRVQWTVTVEPANTGSLVVAATFYEERRAEGIWADTPVEINRAHGIYLGFLRRVEEQLHKANPVDSSP